MVNWKSKLLAFLHDPPSKPFNVAEHRQIAAKLIEQAGFKDLQMAAAFFDKVCDHTAAAADRVVCPKSSAMHAEWHCHEAFKHPLGGGTLSFQDSLTAARAEELVTQAQTKLGLCEKMPDSQQDWARFFLHWRLWPRYCAEAHPSLIHLPADTRIPDHSVWTHCSLVSALQACVEVTGEADRIERHQFKPAFLLVQMGPVQEFISQARPTRDLWSGSYLLSWLLAHGIKAVTEQVGPDSVLFPALRGQPLFDFVHKKELYETLGLWTAQEPLHLDEHILTPNLPNRFLAVVPEWEAGRLAEAAKRAIETELGALSTECKAWLKRQGHALDASAQQRWDQQVRQFLTIHWQVWPWAGDVSTAAANFHQLPTGKEKAQGQQMSPSESLQAAYDAATTGIPFADLDPRNYKHRSWPEGGVWKSACVDAEGKDLQEGDEPIIENSGFAWAAHYAAAEFYLAARRNTRDFSPWGQWQDGKCADLRQREGATKDVLSGKEESIGDETWQKALAELSHHFFREGDRLGAINLIKRIWHVAYLDEKKGLKRRRVAFDSVPAVAAATWREALLNATAPAGKPRELLVESSAFGPLASAAAKFFPAEIADWDANSDRAWLERSDGSIFHLVEWDRAIRDAQARPEREDGSRAEVLQKLRAAREALARLQGKEGGLNSSPGRYVAILAMDGDSMGQWVSGARSPRLRNQLANDALEYFSKTQPAAASPGALQKLLGAPRHVSPSYHLQFSEALASFSLYLAQPIVEAFDGQLIYSGGDDVLAMLPAECALDCARALRMAFRGDPDLPTVFGGALDTRVKDPQGNPLPGDQQPGWGFVAIDGDWQGWTRLERRWLPRGYQLLVPGKNADISAGLAIGHMHTPLQNLVEAARQAEKAAKRDCGKGGYGKSAFAVHLYKRSGEIIRWGAQWGDGAVEVTDRFQQLSGASGSARAPLSAKFPYALAAALRPYTPAIQPSLPAKPSAFKIEVVNGFDPFQVFRQEFRHALRQHSDEEWRLANPEAVSQFIRLAVGTDGGDGYLQKCRSRTLDDFLGPFLTTTFIRKGGD